FPSDTVALLLQAELVYGLVVALTTCKVGLSPEAVLNWAAAKATGAKLNKAAAPRATAENLPIKFIFIYFLFIFCDFLSSLTFKTSIYPPNYINKGLKDEGKLALALSLVG
ncbi:MAG TPA: hypothetical protein VFE87_00915, partial [Candidatus Paceibacterota bacterium]|nr:hypothetical protein [Candidatus Paceibacterota bacterium]